MFVALHSEAASDPILGSKTVPGSPTQPQSDNIEENVEPGHHLDCGSSSTTKDEAETQTQARQTRGAACFVCCVGFGRN